MPPNPKKEFWDCPIAIIAFNRPDYLKEVLDSLARSPDIEEFEVPVFLFCDGGEDAKTEEILEVAKRYPFISDVICQSENLNIPHHLALIRKTIFDVWQYPRFIYLEDDVTVSQYYYRFINRAADWAFSKYPDVVAINSNIICRLPVEEKHRLQNSFVESRASLCNCLYSKKSQDISRDVMDEYLDRFVKKGELKNIDHDAVIAWARSRYDTCGYPFHKSHWDATVSGPDNMLSMAFVTHGCRYVSSIVNRVKYIGKCHGVHCTDEWWEREGFDNIDIIEFPSDKTNREFVIHTI